MAKKQIEATDKKRTTKKAANKQEQSQTRLGSAERKQA